MEDTNSVIVRTRFAPSPTGELHIGGVRTALFCYLWAKKNGGKFVLRIEDTDTKRNEEEFVKSLYEDLIWLGIKPDESIFQSGEYGSYRQIQRLDIYQRYTDKLIKEEKAYYCFCSPEELTREKENYIKENKRSNYQYSRKCLELSENEVEFFLHENKPYVLRLKVPQEKNYFFQDLVRGKVNFQGKDIEDFVLFRQNGIPNYNFACVVDDYLMKISHVLRGEEHLSNTGKQLVLYRALEWEPPQFGHFSLILNKEKKKLSKRDKETSQFQLIRQLRELGYLSQAVFNYLLFLGWHPGTTQEIFSAEEAIKSFDLTGLNARGAVYSLEKLNWYNNYYIQQLGLNEFSEYSWKVLEREYNLELEKKEWVKQVALLFRPQLNYFQELVSLSEYFFCSPNPETGLICNVEELKNVSQLLAQIKEWKEESIQKILSSIEKKIFPLIRKKLTGKKSGPELIKIINLLGQEEIIKRLQF